MALEGKRLHFLPPWPSGSPPLPVRQGAGERTLLRLQRRVGRGWEELEAPPKEQIPRGYQEGYAYHVCRASMGGMLKLKSNSMQAHLITATNSQMLSKLPMSQKLRS